VLSRTANLRAYPLRACTVHVGALKRLESDGLVARKAYPVGPPTVEYSLTPLGREVALKVEALADWIEGNLPQIMAARTLPEA